MMKMTVSPFTKFSQVPGPVLGAFQPDCIHGLEQPGGISTAARTGGSDTLQNLPKAIQRVRGAAGR